jgi:prolyl-tRNA synthetase
MRYSKLFGKTKKEAPKDEVSQSAQLLIRAGYIYKEMAGVYTFLPLGLRVLNKIMDILREEMNAIGGQELALTTLQEKELWEKSGRWSDDTVDVWFKTKLKNDSELGLGLTHEEPITRMATQYVQSYKDLPFYLYQIQNKFRNEIRSKSGIIRGREFLMKDLYSFNRTTQELDDFYENCQQAYLNFFKRIGIGSDTYLTFASGGIFSKYSHEFQTVCESGEDTIYLDRSKRIAVNEEVYTDEVLENLGLKKSELEQVKSIETGNIFKLGTRYSELLGLKYTDENGDEQPVIMGSYGIGPGRAMGTIAEISHDDKGIIWPESVTPYQVHLVGLNLDDATVKETAETAYDFLQKNKIEVLYDDREDSSAGEKFADADLIGIPLRAVVSKKSGEHIEIRYRTEKNSELIGLEKMVEQLKK